MKKLLVIFVFVTICIFAFAQENYQDVIYLKNGSVIHGLIIEQIPNKSIKIQTVDRSVFVYQIEEVKKMTKEINQTQSIAPKVKKESRHGYLLLIENSFGIGIDSYKTTLEQFSVINGYRFNSYISLGIGTGFRYCFNPDLYIRKAFLPLFADFRVNFNNEKVTPYMSLDLGSVYNLKDDTEDPCFIINPSFGVKFRFTQRMGLNVGIGYELYNLESHDQYEVFNSISLKLGFSF